LIALSNFLFIGSTDFWSSYFLNEMVSFNF
jgi:hypothetical protein